MKLTRLIGPAAGLLSILFSGSLLAQAGGSVQVSYSLAPTGIPALGSLGLLALGLLLGALALRSLRRSGSGAFVVLLASGLLLAGSGSGLLRQAEALFPSTDFAFSGNGSPFVVAEFPATLLNDLDQAQQLGALTATCPGDGTATLSGSCASGQVLAAQGGSCTLDLLCEAARDFKYVFVTSETYLGDMSIASSNYVSTPNKEAGVGTQAADSHCNRLAVAGGLQAGDEENFSAYISDSNESYNTRTGSVTINDTDTPHRLSDEGRTLVADSGAKLLTEDLKAAISRDENGTDLSQVITTLVAWTNTFKGLASSTEVNCNNWQIGSASDKGGVGGVYEPDSSEWQMLGSAECGVNLYLVCIEQ